MLQQYRVSGIDRETGEVIEISVQSDGIEGATAKAARSNISVESVYLEQTFSSSPLPLMPHLSQGHKVDENPRMELEKIYQRSRHRWWLLIVGFMILATVTVYPIISLLFGLSILFLCCGVFIPQVKGISYQLIKMDAATPWRQGFRLAAYGMAGCFFVFIGWSTFEMKIEEQRAAARQAAATAESQKLAQEANVKVFALVKEAEAYAESGDLRNAETKIESAFSVPHATEFGKARKLRKLIGYTNDPEHVTSVLVKLSDEEFAKITDPGKLPDILISGYAGLDQAMLAVADTVKGQAIATREELKQERLKMEQAAQEAAAKAEAERKAKELAAAEERNKAELARQEAEQRRLGLKWFYSESQDAMGRGKIKTAVVRSLNQLEFDFPYSGPQRATLRLRVHPEYGRDVILSIERGQFLCGIDDCSVNVRFGNGKPVAYHVSEPADHSTTSLFIGNYERFVANTKKVDKVSIEAQFFQEGNRVFEFDVSGLEWP